jgi:hypothetical protein
LRVMHAAALMDRYGAGARGIIYLPNMGGSEDADN